MSAQIERSRPETVDQAQSFGQVVSHAVGAGLCHACASQLAWGVQNGFTEVRPPCDACAPIVAGWPVPRPRGWRTPIGTLSRPPAWAKLSHHSGGRTAPRKQDS